MNVVPTSGYQTALTLYLYRSPVAPSSTCIPLPNPVVPDTCFFKTIFRSSKANNYCTVPQLIERHSPQRFKVSNSRLSHRYPIFCGPTTRELTNTHELETDPHYLGCYIVSWMFCLSPYASNFLGALTISFLFPSLRPMHRSVWYCWARWHKGEVRRGNLPRKGPNGPSCARFQTRPSVFLGHCRIPLYTSSFRLFDVMNDREPDVTALVR